MKNYHQNYLSEADKTSFNLKNHSKYLDIILSKPGITQHVVFMKEVGREYFAGNNIPTTLYNQGLLTPLPAVPGSRRFLDREVVAIVYVMVIVARPISQNIADDNHDGFGHTCLMGILGLHTEKALQWCCKTCADGVNRITAAVCPFCEYWTTNNSSLNNHVRKHYGMAIACYQKWVYNIHSRTIDEMSHKQ